jgi:hypothetical protein
MLIFYLSALRTWRHKLTANYNLPRLSLVIKALREVCEENGVAIGYAPSHGGQWFYAKMGKKDSSSRPHRITSFTRQEPLILEISLVVP